MLSCTLDVTIVVLRMESQGQLSVFAKKVTGLEYEDASLTSRSLVRGGAGLVI
jgi:hypothetical protein